MHFDINRIKKTSKEKRFLPSLVADLRKAKELKELESAFAVDAPLMKEVLGNYFNDFDTDIERVLSAIEVARNIIRLVGELPLPTNISNFGSFGGVVHPNLKIISNRLHAALHEWQKVIEEYGSIISSKCLIATRLPISESPVVLLRQYFNNLFVAFKEFNSIIDAIVSTKKIDRFDSCLQISEIMDNLYKTKEIENEIQNKSDQLTQSFGNKFHGLETNWQEIISALNWTKEFIDLVKVATVSDEFLVNVVTGIRPSSAEIADLESEQQTAEHRVLELEEYFNDNEKQFSPVRLAHLNFNNIIDESNRLIDRIEDLRYWLDYISIAEEMRKYGLELFLETIIANPPDSMQLSDIFVKSFYTSWTNKICDEVVVLGDFRGTHHDDNVAEFRALDKKLNSLSSSLIIESLNKLRNDVLDGVRGSEVSVLRDQAARVRSHLPLRVLFSRVPHLLLKLKPCLLMSPLSVSHFIEQTKFKFDLVIFDEASQICSEDAVGAIARGEQLIVAGDNMQLPPTKFFQGNTTDDEDAEESDDSFGIYQSVLDECEKIGLTPHPLTLKWHYRSKHEGLIAYSNLRFYKNKLVTFPCAKEKHDDLGVKFRYVANGVYDRGRKKNNNINEAEVVADLVFEHFTKYGDSKTLGVATLNISQKDTVMDVIEQKRKSRTELDKYFLDDRLSGFFVKNLESVQGDERDVIILSLGYGRDSQGKFTMNFGPINKDGGEKRLNVIVTRAKEKLILVSSIKASDFDLNNLNTEGVRHLYHYLDYAERGKDALELQNIVDGDTDLPPEKWTQRRVGVSINTGS